MSHRNIFYAKMQKFYIKFWVIMAHGAIGHCQHQILAFAICCLQVEFVLDPQMN